LIDRSIDRFASIIKPKGREARQRGAAGVSSSFWWAVTGKEKWEEVAAGFYVARRGLNQIKGKIPASAKYLARGQQVGDWAGTRVEVVFGSHSLTWHLRSHVFVMVVSCWGRVRG
jgi:hypothetical protein